MKMPTMPLRGLVLGSMLVFALPSRAEPNACSLLKPSDLNALLGGVAIATPNGGACKWTAPGSTRKLLAARLKASGRGAEMAFAGARSNAGKDGKSKVTDEAGIGDQAFAVQTSFGVSLFTLKQGRMFELQYWINAAGTAKDVEALRPVAMKAAAAF